MSRRMFVIGIFAIGLLGAVRVAATHRVFAQVVDEPVHIAAGQQYLATGIYRVDVEHPPLARVLAALPLWMSGVRAPADRQGVRQGNAILMNGGRYVHNLALARSGNLLFLALAIMTAALWGAYLAGESAGIIAALFVAFLPPLLGHAGVATTDMAAGATIPFALYALTLWLGAPGIRRALLLGFAIGLGLLSKFSFVIFFPVGAIVVILFHRRRVAVRHALLIGGIAVVIVWAGYRFEAGTVSSVSHHAKAVAAEVFPASIRGAAQWFVDTVPLPAPSYANGLLAVRLHDVRGHSAYLFGEISRNGWWYYFPVALFFKTPLPLLLLTLCALFVRRAREPALIAAVMLAAAMTASINIGIRHLLPLYVPMAVAAAAVVVSLRNRIPRVITSALVVWMFVNSIVAHPDYLAWFNELAGAHPERILVDSNLDWGQDILRLRRAAAEEHVREMSALLFTTADLDALGLPPRTEATPVAPSHGWVAVSETSYQLAGENRAFAWLRGQPYRRIGKSIRLYYLP